MGKPTMTEELQQLFAQVSVTACTDNNPLPDSSVTGIIKPTVVTSKQAQLANIHTPAEANTNTPCPKEAQLEALHQSQPALGEGIASTRPTTTTTPPSCLEPLVDAWSPSSSEDGSDSGHSLTPCSRTQPARAKMCTPQMAKEISAFSPGVFIEITTASDPHDRIKEEDDCGEGMVLRGFWSGLPLYYSVTSRHQELLAIQTRTIIGTQCVTQPIESCFGKKQQIEAARKAANSDSGCYTEEAHEKPLPPNRTFSNHWFAVGKSPLGGFGVFAIVDIPQSTHILLEQPLFTIKQYKFLERKYQSLDEEEKAVFDGLHGYHKQNPDPLHQKWNANHFYLSTSSEGVFAIASNFNHACKPQRNTQYCWDDRRQVMTFTATRAIAKGDEILISYGTNRRHIFKNFGFVCHCGGCDDEEWEPAATNFWQQF